MDSREITTTNGSFVGVCIQSTLSGGEEWLSGGGGAHTVSECS